MEDDMSRPVLQTLGIHGLDEIEPVILAALAGESTLLLIGEHGSGKSMLLERIAAALDLQWRHYNTSLLSFDDLVGYPVPDTTGNLQFVKTPAAIWGAHAVFFDEISRARPDVQNKVFPIIHERRVQGMDLDGLTYRWAAMNPPSEDADSDYVGSEPLDVALADRFAFHVTIPTWRSLPEAIQKSILADNTTAKPLPALGERLANIAAHADDVQVAFGDMISNYTIRIAAGLAYAKQPVSARRAVMIARNIALVHAAMHGSQASTRGDKSLADSSWLALQNSLPQSASAQSVDVIKLLALHREVAIVAYAGQDDGRAYVLKEQDPVKRIGLALKLQQLGSEERGALIMDAIVTLQNETPAAAYACGWWLVSQSQHEALPPAVAEELALLYRQAAVPTRLYHRCAKHSERGRAYTKFDDLQKQVDVDDPAEVALIHLLSSQLQHQIIESVEAINKTVSQWQDALQSLMPEQESEHVRT
jgi:MoxR-like ATPase